MADAKNETASGIVNQVKTIDILLVMSVKCQRQANTAMPVETDMPALR